MRYYLLLLGVAIALGIGAIVVGPPPQQPPEPRRPICPLPTYPHVPGGGQQIGKNPPQNRTMDEPRFGPGCDVMADPKCRERNPI